ncbi:MAG: hypothetical protein AB7J32_16870 [Pseudonocardia sp.]
MSAPTSPSQQAANTRTIYAVVGGVLVVLLIVMLISWNYHRRSEEALAKATQLTAEFHAAGLATLNPQQVADALGTDGGQVCALAGNGQLLGYLKTRLGVGGEFYFRPTIVQRNTVVGVGLVMKVYCPDKLADAERFLAGLKYAEPTTG